MNTTEVEARLKALREPSRRIFTVLYKHPGWITRKALAAEIGHKTLFLYDREQLSQMVRDGLIEEDAQDLEIMVRYRYRVQPTVRSALQQLIAERQKSKANVESV
jgi:hypothetical protein